jgi:peroxiredoxin
MTKDKTDLAIKGAIVAALAVLGVVIFLGVHERVIQVGDSAPDFSITTDKGLVLSSASFKGRVLVLNFWATWCAPCVEEIPSLDQFQQRVADSGVVVLAVSVDRNQKLYDRFLKRFPVSFQTARDPEANISADYGTYKYPETYVIDRDGKVVQKVISSRDWTDPDIINFVKRL